MTTRQTEKQKHIDRIAALQSRMQELLGIDHLEYSYTMYWYGLEYIKLYLPHDMNAWDITQRSADYWRNWRNNWMLREDETVRHFEEMPEWLRPLAWDSLHDPTILIKYKGAGGLFMIDRSIDEIRENSRKQPFV